MRFYWHAHPANASTTAPAPALESRVIKSELYKSELRVSLAFSAAGALCSAAYLFPYKRAAAFAAPAVLAFALLVVAALLNTAFSVWQLRRSGTVVTERPLLWSTSALLALLTISGNLCGAQAITRLDPAIASVLLRTEVVFVGGLGALLLHERISWTLALGAGLALAGLCVMRWPLVFDAGGAGAAWALGAACSFGLMQVLTRRVIRRISPLTVNAVRLWLAVATLAFVPGMLSSALGAGQRFWALVALAGLFGPFLGRLCIMYSLRALEAAHSALLLLLAPVLAFIIGYIGWGTLPSSRESAGGALMLLGIALPSLVALGDRARAG
jgi:drug/metabolite transporter (DMT)-like permease